MEGKMMASIETRIARLEKELTNDGKRQTILVFGTDSVPKDTPANAIIIHVADDLRGI